MQDFSYLFLESLRLIFLVAVIFIILRRGTIAFGRSFSGWNYLFAGLMLTILATLIDVLDDYSFFSPILGLLSSNTWIILEKVVGYFLGSILVLYGTYKLIPTLTEMHQASSSLQGYNFPGEEKQRDLTLEKAFTTFSENEKRYEILSDLSNEGIAIHHDGTIIEVNQAFCRQSGYPYDELISMEIWKLFTPESIPEMRKRVANKDDEPYESVFLRKDGSQWPAEIQGKNFTYKGKPARAASVRNISQKKQMQQKLNAIERHRQQIINNTPLILFALNPQGIITLIDGKALEKLELNQSEILNRSIFDVFAQNQDIIQATNKALQGESVQFHTSVGSAYYDVTLMPIFNGQNELSEISGTAMDITNRHQAELAMRESDEKYKAIVDGIAKIGEGILIIDDDYKIHYMNSILIEWFGDQTGNICYTSFGGADANACDYCKLKQVTQDKKNVLYQVQKPNGHIYDIVGAPINMSDGRIAKLEIIRDVTEVEQAAQKLRMLSYAVEQSSSSLLITDSDGRIEYVNQKCCEATGYSAEEVIGQKTSIFKSGYTNPAIYDDLWDAITHGREWRGEFLNKHKNGELYWERTAIAPFKSPQSDTTSFVAIKEDITERKKAEETLRLSATVFDTASEAVMITDKNNKIQMVNKAFYQITGYDEEEIIGHDPAILRSGRHSEQFYQSMWQELHENGNWEGEIWNRRKNGEVFPEWLSITLVKDDNQHLSHYVSLFSDISKRKKDEQRIIYQANYDALTGLPNRNLFKDRLSQAMQQADREKQLLALLFIDLDRFKHINDSMGHLAGDKLLQSAAQRLSETIRSSDTIARLGGDEFTMIMTGFEDIHTVEDTVNQLLSRLETPHKINGEETFISASIGIAVFPDDGTDIDTLLVNADNAMYRVKETGRNGYQFFTQEMNIEAHARQELDTALHQALENNEFILHFQPIVDLSDEQAIGTEALIRWHNPKVGLIPPGQFIPLAEDTGLIEPIGEWVLNTACSKAAQWQSLNGTSPGVSVNMSVRQFQRKNVVEMVKNAILRSQLPAQRLTLEITESLLGLDNKNLLQTLHELRDLGIAIAIDDFGTGYSSLSYLKRFPITHLKIDRSFIMDVTTDPESEALVDAILSMAKSLKLEVIAEGVENREQVDFLKQRQCDRIQGYFFGRPVPNEQLPWVIE